MASTRRDRNAQLAGEAINRARRHMRAARTLGWFGLPDQAYAHTVLAIEECSVYQLRKLVHDGLVSFDEVDAKTRGIKYFDEADLASHLEKQDAFSERANESAFLGAILGLLILLASRSPDVAKKADLPRGSGLAGLLILAASAGMVISDSENWEGLKQAAFYSGPRRPGQPTRTPPGKQQFRDLFKRAKTWLANASREAGGWTSGPRRAEPREQ